MADGAYPSILIEGDPPLDLLATALASCFGVPYERVTLFTWAEVDQTVDADPVIVLWGPDANFRDSFVEAQLVRHELGDAPVHIDVDYDAPGEDHPLPDFAVRLAALLNMPVTYDIGASDPYAYRRIEPSGAAADVSVRDVADFQPVIDGKSGYLIFPDEEVR